MMSNISFKRSLYTLLLLLITTTVFPISATAIDATADEQKCLESAGVKNITQIQEADRKVLLSHCADYLYLITKFDLGGDSKKGGLTKETAIFGLNPEFASRVAKFLRQADGAGKNIRLNSACRNQAAQQSANPAVQVSRHMLGVAVDLNWGPGSLNDCSSDTYRWVSQALRMNGLLIAVPRAPECNHVEALNNNGERAARPPGKGNNCGVNTASLSPFSGGSGGAAPSAGASDKLRQFLGGMTGQTAAQQQQQAALQQATNCAITGGTWANGYCMPGQNTQPQLPQTPTGAQPSGGSGGSPSTSGSSGSSGGTPSTPTSGTPDPVLTCASEAASPVCATQTKCPSTVSPSASCAVGSKKTYLNRCLMNLDKATFINEGACGAVSTITTISGQNSVTSPKPTTTVTLVDTTQTAQNLQNLGESTSTFKAAPLPGTPSQNVVTMTPGSPSQQTFSDNNTAVIPVPFGAGADSTFVNTALSNITVALNRLLQIITPMRYTVTTYSEEGEGHEEEFISEEGIELYVE